MEDCCEVCRHGGDCRIDAEWAWHESGADIPNWAVGLLGFAGLTVTLLAYVLLIAIPYE